MNKRRLRKNYEILNIFFNTFEFDVSQALWNVFESSLQPVLQVASESLHLLSHTAVHNRIKYISLNLRLIWLGINNP